MFVRFIKGEGGATLVEYGIALILAITVGVSGLATLAAQTEANAIGAGVTLAQR